MSVNRNVTTPEGSTAVTAFLGPLHVALKAQLVGHLPIAVPVVTVGVVAAWARASNAPQSQQKNVDPPQPSANTAGGGLSGIRFSGMSSSATPVKERLCQQNPSQERPTRGQGPCGPYDLADLRISGIARSRFHAGPFCVPVTPRRSGRSAEKTFVGSADTR